MIWSSSSESEDIPPSPCVPQPPVLNGSEISSGKNKSRMRKAVRGNSLEMCGLEASLTIDNPLGEDACSSFSKRTFFAFFQTLRVKGETRNGRPKFAREPTSKRARRRGPSVRQPSSPAGFLESRMGPASPPDSHPAVGTVGRTVGRMNRQGTNEEYRESGRVSAGRRSNNSVIKCTTTQRASDPATHPPAHPSLGFPPPHTQTDSQTQPGTRIQPRGGSREKEPNGESRRDRQRLGTIC